MTAPPGLEQALEPGAAERYLLFELATGIYALPVILLRELAEAPAITPLPLVPEWIRGLTQLRGDVLAVVDLLPFLGGEPLPDQASNRLLVVGGQAGGAQAGILVPRVLGTAAVPLGDLAPPTASRGTTPSPIAPFVLAQFPRISPSSEPGSEVSVLDVENLLAALAVKTPVGPRFATAPEIR